MTGRKFIAVFAGALFAATGALAQQAGSYSGTSADNSNISLTVTESGGVFTIGTMNVGFVAACNVPGNSVSESWGFYLGQQLVNGAADFVSHNDYYYTFGKLHFSGNHVIKGVITTVTATFVPGNTPPIKSQFCKSPNQAFTLTKQPAAELPPIAPGAAVVLRQQGNQPQ
jgi:hypothetical protein